MYLYCSNILIVSHRQKFLRFKDLKSEDLIPNSVCVGPLANIISATWERSYDIIGFLCSTYVLQKMLAISFYSSG